MQGRNAALIQRFFPGCRSPKAAYAGVLDHRVRSDTRGRDIGRAKRLCSDDQLNRELPRRARLVVGVDSYFFARREWQDFSEDFFRTWYQANSVGRLRRLLRSAGFGEERLERLSLAHSFGFGAALYALSLLLERLINWMRLDVLKADILGVFVRTDEESTSEPEFPTARVQAKTGT